MQFRLNPVFRIPIYFLHSREQDKDKTRRITVMMKEEKGEGRDPTWITTYRIETTSDYVSLPYIGVTVAAPFSCAVRRLDVEEKQVRQRTKS